jgi:hypothetical protein
MLKKLAVNTKSKAQGLVEFALILTLLLTLLYGIMEASRLLFIYASTVTAARQATRYGSATGNNTGGIPYYKDCAGIRNAAKRIGFLSPFADADILISYDNGPGTADLGWTCPVGGAFTGGTAATGNRIVVSVSTTWVPIIGSLVPLRINGDNIITKQSERTIISSIAIGVAAAPGAWPGSGGITLTTVVSTSPTNYDHVGQVIQFTYTMTNATNPGVDLVGSFTVAANYGLAICGAGYTIYPGLSLTCNGYYTITQADLDAGSITNIASVSTSGASSNETTNIVNAAQTRKLTLAISPSSPVAKLNDVIIYTYTLTNSGNVTLTSPVYTVSDNKLGAVTCPSPATVAPGGEIPCTDKTYTITAADVTAKTFVNTATLNYALMTPNPQTATATVDTAPLVLVVTPTMLTPAPPSITTQIEYTYRIRNNYSAVVNNLTVTDSKFGVIAACPGSIPMGSFVECTYTYTVIQADIDTGAIVSSTTATADPSLSSRVMPVSVPLAQIDALSFTISPTTVPISAGFPTVTAVGNTFTFNYKLKNDGNTTLTSLYTITLPTTTNPSTIRGGTALTVTCGTGDLLPGASTTDNFCSSTTTSVIANDLNGTYGSFITNLAAANAKTKVGTRPVASAPQTGLVAVYNGARLALGVTANPVGTQIQYAYTLTNTGNVPVTLPSPYNITYKITVAADGSGPILATASFACAPATSTLAVNMSVSCTNGSTYTTTLTTGNLTNTATALATTTSPPLTDPTDIKGTVTIAVNSLCIVTHSGPVPNTTLIGGVNKTTWTIFNKINPAAAVHIKSITISWATLSTPPVNIKNINLSGTSVWTGTSAASGLTITSSPGGSPTWPLTVNSGAQPMVLTFSAYTAGIRVIIGFDPVLDPTCSAGLDSGNPAQQEPIVSGGITETVSNITLSDTVPTITGSGGATCSKTTTSYTCSMQGGSGTITVGAYSTGTTTALNNMVCIKPVPTSGSGRDTPWATVSGSGATEITAFKFSALPANTTFDILIANQTTPVGTTGYTCYSVSVP